MARGKRNETCGTVIRGTQKSGGLYRNSTWYDVPQSYILIIIPTQHVLNYFACVY